VDVSVHVRGPGCRLRWTRHGPARERGRRGVVPATAAAWPRTPSGGGPPSPWRTPLSSRPWPQPTSPPSSRV